MPSPPPSPGPRGSLTSTAPQVRSARGPDGLRPTTPPPRGISLRARVVAGYVLMLVLFAIVFATVLVQLRQLQSDLTLLSEGYLPLAQQIAAVSAWSPEEEDANPATVERLYRDRRRDAWLFKRLEAHLDVSRRILEAMLDEPLPELDRTSLRPIHAHVQLALQATDGVQDSQALFVQAMEREDGDEALTQLVEMLKEEKRIDRNVRVLGTRVQRRISEVVERTRERQGDAALLAASVSALAFFVALLLLLNTHFALRPIRRLTTGAERIRAGSFDERVPEETRDEIGRLAHAFNSMAASVQEREAALERRSQQLQQALDDLQASQERVIRTERLAAIGHMAAQIAHEVRNPLNALGLNADLLGDEIRDGHAEDAEELLAAIRNEIRRLTDITEAYLSVGRMPPLRLEPQPLGPLVEELVRFQREEIEAAGVTVTVDVGPDLPEAHVDGDQLRQALLNILRNAVDALRGDGGAIAVSASQQGRWLVLRVQDDGPGMDAEHVERIFDPFFSTKESGSGLGLPLTQQVVAEHGGRITCISRPGEGTTFTIHLPTAPDPP